MAPIPSLSMMRTSTGAESGLMACRFLTRLDVQRDQANAPSVVRGEKVQMATGEGIRLLVPRENLLDFRMAGVVSFLSVPHQPPS